jgi:hypothetical protein
MEQSGLRLRVNGSETQGTSVGIRDSSIASCQRARIADSCSLIKSIPVV